MRFRYPPALRESVVDDYHGTPVSDPYRRLEDPSDPSTRAFVAAQNELTRAHLDSLPEVDRLRTRIAALWDVPRTDLPATRSGVSVWGANPGSNDQPTFWVKDVGAERVLFDPNALTGDGTAAVVTSALSPDGRHWAYSVAESGSDWQVIRVRTTTEGRDLAEEIRFVKFTSIAWWRDGFFYGRFPEQDSSSSEPSRHQRVMYHRLGTPQSDDVEWFANRDDPDLLYDPHVTHDDRWLVLSEWNGTARENGLLVHELIEPLGSGWVRLVDHGVAVHDVVDSSGGDLLVLTDLGAPRRRVVRLPMAGGSSIEVIPESAGTIEYANLAAGRLVLTVLEDASHRVRIHALDGEPRGEVPLPDLGTITGVSGTASESDIYLAFQSFLYPPRVIQVDASGARLFAGAEPPVDPASVTVERIEARSSDGAAVPMFLLRPTGFDRAGPVELYGYGGFTVNVTPMFDPARLAFIQEGGAVAVANLRGGAEFGEEWHRQGMLGRKQQVFDDFIACAEVLIAQGIGAPGTVGIRGRSNGGLLAAACMLQRPDLFGAVVSQVPVTDMLRYQHFTAGRYWTVEYGDASDPEAFQWLIAYSPYHRAASVGGLPPLLITTAEGDDRVVPMHALKLAAAVQHAAGGASDRPLLVRIDTRSGHGLGKPASKLIEESADVFGFLLHHLSGG
jgi:prolyl oligopeptidase